MEGSLQVVEFDSLDALVPWREAIRVLNAASSRPSPFVELAFLESFQSFDEYSTPGERPLLLLALEGRNPVGFLPLRRRSVKVLGLPQVRIEHFTGHLADRPGMVSRPEYADRCAAAFLEHVTRRVKGWQFLELIEQDCTSALAKASVTGSRFFSRQWPNNPNSTLEIDDFDTWFRSLAKDWKRNLSKRVRTMAASGDVALLSSADRNAASALLDLYLNVEERSWKEPARVGVRRHPKRVALFRALVSDLAHCSPLFHFLVRQGVPVAAGLSIGHQDTLYMMEIAFDEAEGELAPGNVLTLHVIRDACMRGFRKVNFLGNFSHHKSRWGTATTETAAVQVFRVPSVAYLRAVGGRIRRRLRSTERAQGEVKKNPSKPAELPTIAASDRDASVARGRAALEQLTEAGASVDRVPGSEWESFLPVKSQGS